MPTDVIMPQMGESIFEGTITRWLKKAGDTVQKDEPLFEISTDKVDAEIPSPAAGTLTEIKFPEGATVEINTVVAVLSDSGEASTKTNPELPKPAAKPNPPQVPPTAAPAPQQVPSAPRQGATDVVMPQMGESIFEGTITRWLKKAGDTVQKDEPLFEISTDKVDAEIPSPVSGVLLEIKAAEGETVEINKVVALIGVPGSTPPEPAPSHPASISAKPAPSQSTAKPSTPKPDAASPAPSEPIVNTGKIRSSPLVRRIAKDNNLDLRRVSGTGSEGRITREDILGYLGRQGPGEAPATSSAAASLPALSGDLVPLTKMRAIIAQRMVESLIISPHVHSVFKVDMTRIVRLREREKAAFEQRQGVKLTYMPFLAAAVISALRKFPIVNASLESGSIRYHDHIHLGIAVALEWGLIVPVVKQAETQSFADLARSIADLAARARTKKLKPDEASGSTFTLTNSGIFGEEFGTPIINQPESAILAIGGLKKEAVVLTDDEGNDTIAIRSMQHICLGFDHRTIDGADAGKFMAELKKTLETWNQQIG
jgi:pyruvate dehydrogenase E2 component (dihydrolipoamide acetyltransferase)